jgi:Tfp pilus assembly protein PilF
MSATGPSTAEPIAPAATPCPLPIARSHDRHVIALSVALLIAGTIALYARTAHFGFVDYDDAEYTFGNPRLLAGLSWTGIRWAWTSTYFCNWHPMTWLAYLSVTSLRGINAAGTFHVLNFLIHALNAGLLCVVLWRLTGARRASFIAAALYAWHPLRVESVAWISETKDVLSGLFLLLTILAYAGYAARPSAWRYLLVTVLLVLGLASKPSVVTLPAVLLLLDFWPLERGARVSPLSSDASHRRDDGASKWACLILEKLPWLCLALVVSGLSYHAQKLGGTTSMNAVIPPTARVENAVISIANYVAKTFWPTGLAVFYPHPYLIGKTIPAWQLLLAASFLLLVTIAAVIYHRSIPFLFVGWFWFLGMLLPMLGLMQVGEQAMADRYTYLPAIGLIIAIVWTLKRFTMQPPAPMPLRATALLVALAAIVGCVTMSWSQIGYWRDSQALFDHARQVTQRNYLAKSLLAMADVTAGNGGAALPIAREAVADNPNLALTHHALAKALQQTGDYDAALLEYRRAVQLEPRLAQLRNDVGGLLVEMKHDELAIEQFSLAIKFDPLYAAAHNNLGNALAEVGRIDDAAPHWERALQLDPNLTAAHGWLATALERRGDRQGAIAHFRAAYAAGERRPQWMADLAWLLATDPRSARQDAAMAVQLATEASEAQPDQPLLLDTLAAAHARNGQIDDAIATAERAAHLATAAGQPALAKTIQSRMMIYRAGHPYDAVH